MLSPEELKSLKSGDVIEAPPLLKGVNNTPVLMRVAPKPWPDDRVPVIVTWEGITLGQWLGRVEGGAVKWQTQ